MSSSATDPSNEQQHAQGSAEERVEKGKGKLAEDSSMDDDEDEEDDYEEGEGEPEEPDEDNMEEIDEDNIVGSRTRGKTIDFAQAAKELDEDDEDDEDEDEDFEMEDEEMAD